MSELSAFLNDVTHGDCTLFLKQLPNACVGFVLTDPPYLTNYTPRDGRRVVNDDNDCWLLPAFRQIHRVLKADRLAVSFYGWPWVERFIRAWKTCGLRPVSHLVWTKPYASRQGYTRSHHECGFLLAKGRPSKPIRPVRDVLPWENTGNILHPTQKPVCALRPLIHAYCPPDGLVLDPFAGSGSTGIAARECGRQFILIEKDALHCQTARVRLRK